MASVSDVTVAEDVIQPIHGLGPRQLKLFGSYLPCRVAVGTFLDGLGRRG